MHPTEASHRLERETLSPSGQVLQHAGVGLVESVEVGRHCTQTRGHRSQLGRIRLVDPPVPRRIATALEQVLVEGILHVRSKRTLVIARVVVVC